MKKQIELNVDFIGGGPEPTKEEFVAISKFIKSCKAKQKLKSKKRAIRKPISKQPA